MRRLSIGAVAAVFLSAGAGAFGQSAEQQRDFDRDDQGNQERRAEWFYRQRAYPFDHIPKGAFLNAWRQKEALAAILRARAASPQSKQAQASTSPPVWTFIGPQDNNFWGGNSSGRITALAVDPRGTQVVWAGAADGGVWKTTNGGGNWMPMTDNQPTLSTGALALDPAHPDTVYVGTGEANLSVDSYGGLGILKSTDGGATWLNIPGAFAGAAFGGIAVSPANSQVVLAGSDGGILRSADGGNTWNNVLPGSLGSSVVFNPANPSIAWAGIGYSWGDPTNGVYQSTDGGQTWARVTGTAPNTLPPASQTGRVTIALAPTNPSNVFVGIGPLLGSSSTAGSGVYGSVDGGQNWTLLAQPGYNPNWYENTVAVSPTNASVLIGGGSPLSVSSDGGNTWTLEPSYIHPDQHAVAFSQDGSIVYIGNDGGVYSTTDISNPQADWNDLNATLGVTQFYPGMSLNPENLQVAIGGTQDNGTLLYSGSLDWTWVNCGDGGATAIDPMNPLNIYIACITGPAVAKSTDGGLTNQDMSVGFDTSAGIPWPPFIAIDPSNPSNLYYTADKIVYQTTNAAASWEAISGDLTNSQGSLSVIAVAPSDSNTVYVGTQGGVVQVTRNALSASGATWTNQTAGLPQRYITAVAVDQANPSSAYVTVSGYNSGHMFMTSDGGSSWLDISGNLPDTPVNDLALDPDLQGTIYAGTDAGVFTTSNTGASWEPVGTGLPNAVVTGVRFHHATRTLRVATHGRGMWDVALPLPPLALTAGGIVNAASYGQTSGTTTIDAAVTPGGIAAVFGTSMANVTQATAGSIPLPTQLGGETLSIAGVAAPQFFASRDQLNVQIPWETPLGTANAVLSLGSNSTSGQVQVVEYLPGIFTANGSGQGQGIVVHANSATLVAPTGAYGASYPAAQGEVVTMYATGLGPVDHQPVTGQATPESPLAQTTTLPTVTVGDIASKVSFSGLSPGLVGLYQVNFQVPPTAPPGNYVPVVLSIGGAVSNAVTLAVVIPEIQEPAGGYPQNCSDPLAVPFPVIISGTLASTTQSDCFSISLSQTTKVHFALTGMDGFQGWLFLLNQNLTWNSYVYVTSPDTGTLDATLAAGVWTFNVAWNTDSAAGPYQLLVEQAPPQ
jgi:uncharacterized protein (TIGR03437 family)